MREIYNEFGTAVIAIVTAMLVIGILFGISISGKQGILEMTGIATNKEEIDYTSYKDFDAVITWHNRKKPEAAFLTTLGRFFSNENADFLKSYYAKDMETTIYPMNQVIFSDKFKETMFGKVLDIRKIDGTSVVSHYSAVDGRIQFPSAGVYEVYFQMRDKENKTSVWKIPIAVDERRNE